MSLVSQALVKIIGDDSSAIAALKRVNAAADASEKEFNKSFGKIASHAQSVALGIAAVGVTVVALGGKAVKSAADAEVVWKRLEVTVENSGKSWSSVQGRVEGLAIEMQKFTRFGDEEVADTLQILMAKNGSYEKSIGLVKLTLDTAIGTHKSYQEAAEAVGKASTGNTRAFRELGIVAKSTDDGFLQLQQRFSGMANEDGKTLEAQLIRIKNATDNVFEAFGNAIAGDNAAKSIGGIAGAIQSLADKIEANGPAIHEFFMGLQGAWNNGPGAVFRGAKDVWKDTNTVVDLAITGGRSKGIQSDVDRIDAGWTLKDGRWIAPAGNDNNVGALERALGQGRRGWLGASGPGGEFALQGLFGRVNGTQPARSEQFVNPNFKNTLPDMGPDKATPVLQLGEKVDHYVEKLTTATDLFSRAMRPIVDGVVARDGRIAEARSGMNPDATTTDIVAFHQNRRAANIAAINAAGGLNFEIGDRGVPFARSRRPLGQPIEDSGRLTTRDYMSAGSQAAQGIAATLQGRQSVVGGISSVLGAAGSIAPGPAGTVLQGASMALSLFEGVFGNKQEREQEAYRAHLRAIREARDDQQTVFQIFLPGGVVNTRDPVWKETIANTIVELDGTRTGRIEIKTAGGE